MSAKDSGAAIIAKFPGVVERVTAREILVRRTSDVNGSEVAGDLDRYKLQKYVRSNQGTCYNQKPIIAAGDRVEKGEILADGPSMDMGELALGRNVVVAFMTWDGYNYEDAIIMSERLVKDDVYTSIHIEEYESESRDTKLGQRKSHVIFQTSVTMHFATWTIAESSASVPKSKTATSSSGKLRLKV